MTFRQACVAVAAAGLGIAAAFAGCGKTKESLVLVTVETAAGDTTLKSLTISVGAHGETFMLKDGVGVPADPGVTYGLYLPSDLTGKQTVVAVASPAAGNCNGAAGNSHFSIGTVGEVDGPVVILLSPANVCTGVGGTTGTGGSAGGVGTGGGTATGGNTGTAGSAGGVGTGGLGGIGGTIGLAGHGGAGTGGAAGSGGSAGAGGSAGRGGAGGTGTGGTGTGGAPSSGITACTEYDHGTSGQCQASPCAGDYAIYGAAFSPANPNLAVTSGTDGRTKVWTISGSGMAPEGHVVTGGTGYNVMAFSPDGTQLALGETGGVRIVSTSTWTVTRTLTVAAKVYGVGFSPDGTQVIALDTDTTASPSSHLYVHSVTNITALHSVALSNGFALAVSPVATSGAVLVAVTTSTGNALVYSLTSTGFSAPTTLAVNTSGSTVETAAFSPNGSLLAAGDDDGLLQFWAVPLAATPMPQAPSINVNTVTVGTSDYVDFVAFSPATAELAIGAGFYGSVTTYSTTSRTQIGVEQDTSNVYDVVSLGYSSNGRYIIGGEVDCGCVFLCVH